MNEDAGMKVVSPPAPLPVALAIADALRSAGVRFVHWKSNDHLAAALAGETDIDIFVPQDDRQGFERVMADVGGLKISSQPWARYPRIEDWLVLDRTTGRFLHLHLHYALMTGLKRVKHLRFSWGEALLANLRTDARSGWPIPAAEIELLLLLVRIWAKMPPWRRWISARIPPQAVSELDWLREGATPDRLRALVSDLLPNADPSQVLGVLRPGPFAAPEIIAVARALNEQLAGSVRMPWAAALALALRRNANLALAKAARAVVPEIRTGKTIPAGGVMIALIGSDGAGKSSLCRDLDAWLRFKLDVHVRYMGSGDGGTHLVDWVRRAVKAVLKSVRGRRTPKASNGARATKTKPPSLASKLGVTYQLVLMRHKLRLLRAGRKLAGGGSVVLTDRFPQTQFPGICDGPKIQSGRSFAWAARHEMILYEKAKSLGPDLALKLIIDPATAHGRKPDHDLCVITRKCRIVDALDFPQREVAAVDASRPYDEVLHSAKIAIWDHLLGQRA